MMGDRFARGGLLDDMSSDSLKPVAHSQVSELDPWVTAAKEKKFGQLTRIKSNWSPALLICKRMNIPEPNNG